MKNINTQIEEDRLKQLAENFIKELLPVKPNVICEQCGAENCSNNGTCINCNSQL